MLGPTSGLFHFFTVFLFKNLKICWDLADLEVGTVGRLASGLLLYFLGPSHLFSIQQIPVETDHTLSLVREARA